MNGNNSWQRMSPFARTPDYAGSLPQPQSLPPAPVQQRQLVPMGQVLEGDADPYRESMPAPAMRPQQQDYGEGQQTQGKTILGMPKDRFIALMGTIAQAFGGDSASGRLGAGLVNMAGMMRDERVGRGEAQTETAETRRKEKREDEKERRKAQATKRGKAPTVKPFRIGDRDVQHSFDYETRKWEPIPGMPGKKVTEKADERGQEGFNEIDGVWNKGFWKGNKFTPRRKAAPAEVAKLTQVKPPEGKEPKEPKAMTFPEKRARSKSAHESEKIIKNPEYLAPEFAGELQLEIDKYERYSDKPYTYQLTPGTPGKETGYFDLELDVEAVPSTIEKVDISTPEKIRDSGLPVEQKLRLLRDRFGYD